MSVRTQLLVFISIIIAIFSFLAFLANAMLYRYIDEYEASLADQYNANLFVLGLRANILELENSLRLETSGVQVPSLLVAFTSGTQNLQDLLKALSNNPQKNLEVYFRLRALSAGLAWYIKLGQEAFFLHQEGNVLYYHRVVAAERLTWFLERYVSELQNIRLSSGWQSYRQQSSQAGLMRSVLVIVLIILLIAVLNFSIGFSKSFTQPIITLANLSSRIAAGDLAVPELILATHQGDELGSLARSFNTMSANIRESVRELERKVVLEQGLREAQLLNLQSQIKPHFFFNTLNSIVRHAQRENAVVSEKLIRSLASLFRYSLLGLQNTVTLKQELENLGEYLGLQKMRFTSRFDFRIDADASLDLASIPPLIIQPFAENSVIHGIEPLVGGGKLYVRVRACEPSRIRIHIFDNGKGMDNKTLSLMRSCLDSKDGLVFQAGLVHNLGIQNANSRLRLLYGNAAQICIYSKPETGTLVRISVPLTYEEDTCTAS